MVAIGALLLGFLCIFTCGDVKRRASSPWRREDSEPIEVWERTKPRKQQHRLEELFEELDEGVQSEDNPPGYITASDLFKAMSDTRVAGEFKRLGISQKESSTVFRLIDRDGTGLVSLEEFLAGCVSLGLAPDADHRGESRRLHHFATHGLHQEYAD